MITTIHNHDVLAADLVTLLSEEQREQGTWKSYVPAWHPTNSSGEDGRDDGDDGDDDDDVDVDVTVRRPGADDDDDDDDDDTRSSRGDDDFPWDEHNRLKREAAETAKRARAAERDAKKQRQKSQKDQGNYDELLSEKDEEVSAAAERAEAAEYALEQFKKNNAISKIAGKLGFRDPSDAIQFLGESDVDDDVAIERALKRLGREKPYLVDTKRSSGAPVNGERTTLTVEDIKKMNQDEINSRWDEVQKALSSGTQG